MKLKHTLAIITLSLLGVILFSTSSAQAATFTVATGNDENTNNSSCALSEAIENINDAATTNTDCSPTGAYGTNDTINLPTGTITLVGDLAEITNSISFVGQGRSTSIIDGSNTYSGIYIEDIVDTFSATGFTFRSADSYAVGVCATDITIDQILVDNSGIGAAFACNDGGYTEAASITDSDFTNNESATGTAGLFIRAASDPGCGASLTIDLTRVRANENNVTETGGGVSAGIWIVSDNDCPDPFVETITLEDVEANDNTSSGHSGIGLNNGGSAVTTSVSFNRVSVINNTISGSLGGLEGSPPMAGISTLSMLEATLANVTVSGNSANATSISQSAGSGVSLVSFGAVASYEITNATVTDNSVSNASNVSSGLVSTGFSTLSTADFLTFTPATITNTLAANNTIDGTPDSCVRIVDFGGGPVELPMTSGGGNVIEDDTCAYGLNDPTDQHNVSGLFATLAAPAYNDGFVQTVALLEDSPAVDAGVDVPFSLDAQLLSRSQGTAVDAGAYESPFSLTSGGGSDSEPGDELAESGANQVIAIALASTMLATGIGIASRLRTRYQLSRR